MFEKNGPPIRQKKKVRVGIGLSQHHSKSIRGGGCADEATVGKWNTMMAQHE